MRRVLCLSIVLLVFSSCVTLIKKESSPVQKLETLKAEEKAVMPSHGYRPGAIYYYMVYLTEKGKGNLQKAYESIKEAVKEDPDNIEYLLEAAKFAANLKKVDDAEKFTRKALSIDSRNLQALKLLAGISIVKDRKEEAEKYYKKVLSIAPDKDTYIMLANLYINEKRYSEAEKLLTEALKKYPDNFFIFYFLGEIYFIEE